MRAVLIITNLFMMFYGSLEAFGGDPLTHCVEDIQENRVAGSYKNLCFKYYDRALDYRLTGKDSYYDKISGNQDPVVDLSHLFHLSDLLHLSYVADHLPLGDNIICNSRVIRKNSISDNFLFDFINEAGTRTDLFSGFPLKDHSSETDKSSLSLKKPAFKNIIPVIAGLAYVSFIFDEQVNTFARDNQTSFLKTVAHYTDAGGEKKIVVPGIILTYGTARFLFKNEKLQTTSLNAIQSVIVTAIATESVKNLAGRARPFTYEGPYTFNPFPGSRDQYKSLPSGHASLAFSLFTPFAETYSRWIYLVPVSVAAGRVYQDKHWLSDVVTGGGIGLVSGLLFTHYENITIIPNGLRIYF